MAYLLAYPELVLQMIGRHISLTALAVLIAVGIALPLGWALHTTRRFTGCVMNFLSLLYTIPSIAMMIFLIPLFGLDALSVLVALVIYNLFLIVRNVMAGLDAIDPAVLEAAYAMGMQPAQVAWKVQLPLALPVILAGVRLAVVTSLAISTVGAKFGAGGLGTLLFDGIAQAGRYDKILLGAILVGLLALLLNGMLLSFERAALPYRNPRPGRIR